MDKTMSAHSGCKVIAVPSACPEFAFLLSPQIDNQCFQNYDYSTTETLHGIEVKLQKKEYQVHVETVTPRLD